MMMATWRGTSGVSGTAIVELEWIKIMPIKIVRWAAQESHGGKPCTAARQPGPGLST
jgi:hypothetical protein